MKVGWVPSDEEDRVPSGFFVGDTLRDQLTAGWLKNGGPGWSRCISYIENGDIPASYVIVYQRVGGSWMGMVL